VLFGWLWLFHEATLLSFIEVVKAANQMKLLVDWANAANQMEPLVDLTKVANQIELLVDWAEAANQMEPLVDLTGLRIR
jgi:hypothetical protein